VLDDKEQADRRLLELDVRNLSTSEQVDGESGAALLAE